MRQKISSPQYQNPLGTSSQRAYGGADAANALSPVRLLKRTAAQASLARHYKPKAMGKSLLPWLFDFRDFFRLFLG